MKRRSASLSQTHLTQLQRVALMVDANGAGVGRFAWLRRGWPDLFDQLAVALPRITELT